MKENILYCIAGIVLGFFIGFFIANMSGHQPLGSNATNSARSLDQPRAGGQLPPNHPDINDTGGSAASTSAQAQAAMDEADRNPKDFAAQLKAAAIFYQLGSFDKAALYLNRSLALKPNDADALTGMGQTKYQTGDYTGAATYFEKALTQRPDDADLRASLGDAYFQRKPPDYDRAIVEYRKALGIDPRHEHALAAYADVAFRKGDKTTARSLIDKLTAVNPANDALPTLRSMLNRP